MNNNIEYKIIIHGYKSMILDYLNKYYNDLPLEEKNILCDKLSMYFINKYGNIGINDFSKLIITLFEKNDIHTKIKNLIRKYKLINILTNE